MAAQRAFEPYEIKDFSGGLSEMPLRKPNQSPDCRNVIARGLDLLEKRRGQERLNLSALTHPINGAHAFYKGTTRVLVVASGGSAWQYDPVKRTFTEIKSGILATVPVQFVTCANYMVAFDGATPPWKFDGLNVTDLANAPQDGYLACLHREKLFTVTHSSPSELLWSDSFKPETWIPENHWKVGDGDGDTIRAIKMFKAQSHLAIFKSRSVWAFLGTSLDDFELPPPRVEPGAVGPNAVVEYGPRLFYIAEDGIYAYNGLENAKMTKTLPHTWARVNKKVLSGACCWEWDGLLYFALPVDQSEENNFVLCFDPDTGAWWPYDGIYASCFTQLEETEGSGAIPLTGSSVDGYMVRQGKGTSDFGRPIEGYWTTDLLDLGKPEWRKKLLRLIATSYPAHDPVSAAFVLLGVDPEMRSDSTVLGKTDWFTAHALTPGYSEGLRRRFDFPPGSYCYYLQARISHTGTDRLMKIKSLTFHLKVQDRGV